MFEFERGFQRDTDVYRFVVQGGAVHPVNTITEIALMVGKRGWGDLPNAIAVWSVPSGAKVELDYECVHSNGTFYAWLVWKEPTKATKSWTG